MKSLNLRELRQALQNQEAASVCLVAVGESFELHLMMPSGVAALTEEGGETKVFSSPAEAIRLLHSLGVHELPMVATEKQLYERWLAQKVHASIAGLADGSNRTYSRDEWQAVKAARAARRKVT
jgi:hypothetical protein